MTEAEDLTHVCFKDVAWLQAFPLTEHSVLDYFSLSQFYDRTCTNEQLKMQTRFTTAANGNPSSISTSLVDMVGIEYGLHSSHPPRLFIIHKRQRHSRKDVEILASYYILDGTIYQAPSLLALLKCRVATSLEYLTGAIGMATDNLRYDPSLKQYISPDLVLTADQGGQDAAAEQRALSIFNAISSFRNQ